MKARFWWILFGSILLLSLGSLFLMPHLAPDSLVAEIYQDGTLIQTIDLSTLTQPKEITLVSGENTNIILAEFGQISMKSANCPDQLCVHQGAIKTGLYPIVCLPNRVTIKLTGKAPNQPDAIVSKAGEV